MPTNLPVNLPGRITPISWELPGSLPYEDWITCGKMLMQIGGAVQWALGHWWAFGEHHYGERVGALRDGRLPGRYTFQTLADLGWVVRQVETSRRRELLSFQHHREVAALPAAQQRRWLTRAERGEPDGNGGQRAWSVSRLRKEIKTTQEQDEEQDE